MRLVYDVHILFVVIKELMIRNWKVKLEHIYTDDDCLTSMSIMHDRGV